MSRGRTRPASSSAGAAGPLELEVLAGRLEALCGPAEQHGKARLNAVEFDHRRVRPPGPDGGGALFCCLVGALHDGHDFAAMARDAGAVAFLSERRLGDAAGGAAELVVPPGAGRLAMAEAACALYRDPASRLVTVGVTGTNGKTTVTHLVSSVLAAAGFTPGVIGTLSGPRTTPEAPELQRLFFELSAGPRPAVALEVTSHALVQHRVDGYVHDVAVFTNLSRDHLDYHATMEAYFEAKALLFTPSHSRRGVVNGDDAYGRRLLSSAGIPVEAFSLEDAEGLVLDRDGSRFQLRGHKVHLRLLGRLNVYNALAAAAAARSLGVSDEAVACGLSAAASVRGRFEQVENPLGLAAVVDYAHTPAGLAEACLALRPLISAGGRLIVVFGAGGDRDHEKRPEMGRAVAEAADLAVITSDNPRHEDPDEIIAAVAAGFSSGSEPHVEPDRRLAIRLGLTLAREGDLLLVAGKGHETTQQVGDDFFPFDDREVIGEQARLLVEHR